MTSKAPSSKSPPAPRGMAFAFVAISAVGVAGAVWVSQLMAKNSGDATLAERRERIAAMAAAEKEQLKIKQERFAKLDAGEQARLRALHAAIESHPRRAELTRAMMRYRQWLRELTPEDRASLLTTEITKRLAAAQALQEKLHQRYLAEAGKEMSETESRAVKDWMDALIADRIPKALELVEGREKDGLRWAIEHQNAGFKRGIVWPMIVGGKLPPPVAEADHLRLAATLSPERRATFEKAKSKDERDRVVNAWIMGAMFFRRGGGGPGPSREDLEQELAKLPAEERQRISTLPPEQMHHELRRKWFESRFAHRDGRGPGERGPGERGPGERGPGERGPGERDRPPGPPGPPFGPPRPPRDDDRDDRRGPVRRGDERRDEAGRGGRRDDRDRRNDDRREDRDRATKAEVSPPSTTPTAPEP